MYLSKIFAPRLREVPQDADTVSGQLMLRAGLLRKSASGIYTYLNLGLRVKQRIEEIVRQEMDGHGAQEILMPLLMPAEPWQATGRWELYGDEMFKLTDRKGRQFCLGPTHEELVTTVVGSERHSYKELPFNLYHITNKYRDEIRPRYGLIRSREFTMMDAYSFDRDETAVESSYALMFEAYTNIFSRVGLTFRPIQADSGAIGGSSSHEFTVQADNGECAYAACEHCGYAANLELSKARPARDPEKSIGALPEVEGVPTPGVHSISDVARFFGTDPGTILKSILYIADDKPWLLVLRGDDDINEAKLLKAVKAREGRMATDEEVLNILGVHPGSVGPQNVTVPIVVDEIVRNDIAYIAGAGADGFHVRNVFYGRDFVSDIVADIRTVRAGDLCPVCGHPLHTATGIEVGHTFKLGTKYAVPLHANYVDEDGSEKPYFMGCYGIGIGRTLAAIIEQHHDEKGIVWPMSVAPYQVAIIPLNRGDDAVWRAALDLHEGLQRSGVDVILDDRGESAGVKFNDADLMGFPIHVVIGNSFLKTGSFEVSLRVDKANKSLVPAQEAIAFILNLIKTVA
ncbi:MAG: proline--tRNA ligase [Candidatus Cryosericum sp.]|nr:proline--tRNA ligase [bacterium]